MRMEPRELKSQLTDELLDNEDVSGVGIGEDNDGNEVTVVSVKHGASEKVANALPEDVDEDDVQFRELGEFKAEVVSQEQSRDIDRTAKHRPVPGGVSAGHEDITAGTTGYLVTDGSEQYASSNNHVYADINSGSEGDTIVQPGTYDNGSPSEDKSGELAGYVELRDGVSLDFAWISQTAEHLLNFAELGKPKGEPVDPSIGDVLTKSGRTTGVNEAEVTQVGVDVNVNYGDAGVITVTNTIVTNDMSDGGDSGSATLMKSTMEPAGILFAGSSSATVHCSATEVEPETGLTIVTEGDSGLPTAEVSITLEKEGDSLGNIVVNISDDSGNTVSGADVSISGPVNESGSTNDSGTARFDEVPIGSYTVSASNDGYSDGSGSVAESDFQ